MFQGDVAAAYDSPNAVPHSILTNGKVKSLDGQTSLVKLNPTNGNVSFGESIRFQMNPNINSGYMDCDEMVLAIEPKRLVGDWDDAKDAVQFKGKLRTAYALIEQVKVTAGGQTMEWRDFDLLMEQELIRTSNPDYIEREAQLYLGADYEFKVQDNAGVKFMLPLKLFLKDFPLCYFADGASVEFEFRLNQVARAFTISTAAGATDPEITRGEINAQLIYRRIQPDQNFVNATKQSLLEGGTFAVPFIGRQVFTTTDLVGQNHYVTTPDVASLLSVVMVRFNPASLTSVALASTLKYVADGLKNFTVRINDTPINQQPLTYTAGNPGEIFIELQKAYSKLTDSSYCDLATRATYPTDFFAAGVSCRKYNDPSLLSIGTPCPRLTVEYEANTALQRMLILSYEALLVIDGMGNVVVKKK
jgi:hypothetical protein